MDPPLEAVKVLLDAFHLSCLDMEGFFTACQFAHPNTSRRVPFGKRDMSVKDDASGNRLDGNDDDFDCDTDDIGEVVKLVMNQTIRARHAGGIDWGMVAFLGDARISPSHAKLLLRHAPEALIDPKHGAFDVSPLDRMASGFFIHGETNAWVEKLRLGLRVAAYVGLRRNQLEKEDGVVNPDKILLPRGFFSSDCQLLRRRESSNEDASGSPSSSRPLPTQAFYPYHELIRLLISPHFKGNKFGQNGFLQTLKACTQSDPDAFLRPDNEGNLPIHIALRSECETVLGVKGERRLIKYLLDLDPKMALCPEGSIGCGRKERRLPLRLSVENAWPVYDLIINSTLACCDEECKKASVTSKGYIAANMIVDRPLLHDLLNGPYHPRFGVHGARQLVKNVICRITQHNYQHQNETSDRKGGNHMLASFVDSDGRTALHLCLESKWPVHDVIIQANPHSIESHDPTQHGFLPFQTAACAFTADDVAKEESLTEMSMLFELIRENPLCITWSDEKNQSQLDLRRPKKRSRPS